MLAEFRRVLKPQGIMYITLKEGNGRYEFSSRGLPEVKGIMELWSLDRLMSTLQKHDFEILKTDRKGDVNPNEFQHNKILVACRAI